MNCLLYNPGLNILTLVKNLVDVRLATSKTILDILHNKLGTEVATRVSKRPSQIATEWLKSNKVKPVEVSRSAAIPHRKSQRPRRHSSTDQWARQPKPLEITPPQNIKKPTHGSTPKAALTSGPHNHPGKLWRPQRWLSDAKKRCYR